MNNEIKFNPGDKVRVASPNAPTKEYFEKAYSKSGSTKAAPIRLNDVVTIKSIYGVAYGRNVYHIIEDGGVFLWDEDWFQYENSQSKLTSFLNNISNIREESWNAENWWKGENNS